MIISSAMADIAQLMRQGRLADATALIQTRLAGQAPLPPVASANGGYANAAPASLPLPSGRPERPPSAGAGAARVSLEAGFFSKDYRCGAGSLTYKLYVPKNAVAGMPLVVMLHGCTQSPEDFARGTGMNALADELGFVVAYPGQSQRANAQKCWNWFKPGDQQRERGEPALIAGITRQVLAEHACDPQRVYIAGLSAGGAAAAVMAEAYPDLYAAVGIHSGLACGAARDVPSALIAMKQGGTPGRAAKSSARYVPVITFHGDRDTTVAEVNSRTIGSRAQALAGGLTTHVERGQTGGRSFSRSTSINADGETLIEQWTVHGGGHAWFGGSPAGTYTDTLGPDASREMLRFFLEHRIA